MIFLEKIIEDLVIGLDPIVLNDNVSRSVKVEAGDADDLPRFIQKYGETHYPFVWIVNGIDTELEAWYGRSVELNICTREDRKELLNLERYKDGMSYERILYPIWEALELAIDKSANINITEDTRAFLKAPDFSSDGSYETDEIWDVLNIKFDCTFNENYNC